MTAPYLTVGQAIATSPSFWVTCLLIGVGLALGGPGRRRS